jgi:hypothetical protein
MLVLLFKSEKRSLTQLSAVLLNYLRSDIRPDEMANGFKTIS